MASACYVYAIVDRAAATLPHSLTGINGEPLMLATWQALAAVTSATGEAKIAPRAALLVRHQAVVEVLCQITPTLPVRFGTVLPDVTSVVKALEDHNDTFVADLKRIGGKQEIAVTVLWDTPENSIQGNSNDTNDLDDTNHAGMDHVFAEEKGRGTRYLLTRKEAYQRYQGAHEKAQAVITDLNTILRPYVCESRYTFSSKPKPSVRAAYLLAPEMLVRLRTALARYQAQRRAIQLLVTGPWPPYSFVSIPNGPMSGAEERAMRDDGAPLGA